jgi:hypothetical protein
MDRNKLVTVVIIMLLAGNVFFTWRWQRANQGLIEAKKIAESQKKNAGVSEFAKMFVANVLKSEGEVDFDMRLKLENAVRSLNDKEILEQWNRFVKSGNEADAQKEVKNLLELLVNKI